MSADSLSKCAEHRQIVSLYIYWFNLTIVTFVEIASGWLLCSG